MIWSQDAWPIGVFFLGILLAAYLVEGLVVGFVANLLLRTSLSRHLLSTVVVGGLIFVIIEALIIFLPGSLVSYNSEPQNLRTWLFYNQGKVNAIVVLFGLAVWQYFVRSQKRGAPKN